MSLEFRSQINNFYFWYTECNHSWCDFPCWRCSVIQNMKCRELRYRHYTVSAEPVSKDEDGTNLSETTRRLLDALTTSLQHSRDYLCHLGSS